MAIAIDTTSKGSASATSVTVAMSSAVGASTGLFMIDTEGETDGITTVTQAGNGMTRIDTASNGSGGSGERVFIYGILSPTSGSQNWVANSGASEGWIVFPHTYTGSSTTALPTVTAKNNANSGAIIATLTAPANSWVVGLGANDFVNGISMDAGHPFRQFNGGTSGTSSRGSFDTNAAVTGSDSATFTPGAGTGNVVILTCALELPGTPSTRANTNFSLLGVGS